MDKKHISLKILQDFATKFKAKMDTLLNDKVDKVSGKQLSTNDYTTAEKTKLSGLKNYTLPTASSTTLGGVKVGAGLTVDGEGNLSATGGGTADAVEWENVIGKPTKLSQFTNDSGFQTAANVDTKLANYAKKTDIASVYKYKGSKANYAALPNTENAIGDVWNVEAADNSHGIKAGDNVAWDGTKWDVLAGTIDTSNFATKDELANVKVDFATTGDIDNIITQVFG